MLFLLAAILSISPLGAGRSECRGRFPDGSHSCMRRPLGVGGRTPVWCNRDGTRGPPKVGFWNSDCSWTASRMARRRSLISGSTSPGRATLLWGDALCSNPIWWNHRPHPIVGELVLRRAIPPVQPPYHSWISVLLPIARRWTVAVLPDPLLPTSPLRNHGLGKSSAAPLLRRKSREVKHPFVPGLSVAWCCRPAGLRHMPACHPSPPCSWPPCSRYFGPRELWAESRGSFLNSTWFVE